jgi:hypothetical protein
MNPEIETISPSDLRDFAKNLGWQQMVDAIKDGLFVLSHPSFEKRQLIFPIDVDSPDYNEAVFLTLKKVSETQQTSVDVILSQLQEVNDDSLSFRVIDARNENTYIPLNYAVNAITGAKEMLLAAACTVLKPQTHHPRLSRAEAQELVDKSRFRHTEKGSFVIKVSTPVRAVDILGNLYENNIPFVRQATLSINSALTQLIAAIQNDTLQYLIDELKSTANPEISSNLCKAIVNFNEEYNNFDLFVNFKWANTLPIQNIVGINTIKIQRDYFSRIDEVRRELRIAEEENIEEVFMASVEHLSGDIGADGRRAGEVILNLYKENEIIRARTNLTSAQYADADKSHMIQDSYIKIKGKLRPGNQPRMLADISVFELIMP